MIDIIETNKIYTNDPSFKEGSFCFCECNKIKIPDYPNKPIYFYFKDYFYISSDILFFKKHLNVEFDIKGLTQLFIFGCNFYPFSIYKNIFSLMPNMEIHVFKNSYEFVLPEIKKQNKINDIEKITDKIECLLKKSTEKCSEPSYVLYSGGLDSSIVLHYVDKYCKKIYAGSSVFSEDQLIDVKNGLNYFQNIKSEKIMSDPDAFFEKFMSIKLIYPFINAGIVDDKIHTENAIKRGCKNILTGSGADEVLGDTIHFDFKKIEKTSDFFLKNILTVDKNIISFFGKDIVNEVIDKSIENYKFDIYDERLRFIKDSFLIPIQKMMGQNNCSKLNRVEPFLREDFYNIIKNIDFDLINTNKIEKYILRLFAKKILPRELYLKKSNDFDYCPQKNVNKLFYDLLKKNKNSIESLYDNSLKDVEIISKHECLKLCFLIKILEQF